MSDTAASPGGARFEWANMLRGVASLSVVVGHFAVVFWMAQDAGASLARRPALYPGSTGAPAFSRALAAVPVDFGAFGVGLFFLVSGFVIAVSVDRYSRRGFVVGRLTRILPTYAAGYLVTCGVVAVMRDPHHELGVVPVLVGCVPGLGVLLGVPTPGDGIVWTLIIELVFYVVCLVAYRRMTRGWVPVLAVAAACAGAQVGLGHLGPVTGRFWSGLSYLVALAAPFIPLMLVGVVLSGHRRGHLRTGAVAALVPVLVVVHTVLLRTNPVVHVGVPFHVGCLLAVVLFLLGWRTGGAWRRSRPVDALADLSYPLYVVHAVLGYAILSVLAGRGVPPVLAVLVATAAGLGAAWVLHRVVEVPTHHWGRGWARRLTPAAPVTAPERDATETAEPVAQP